MKIKNLIIGNNKFKSLYLKERLVCRLLALINDYYLNHLVTIINQNPHLLNTTTNNNNNNNNGSHHHRHHHHHQKSSPSSSANTSATQPLVNIDAHLVDIINQILIILSSFALGNLDHCTQLIQNYRLHDMLFNLIRLARIYYTELVNTLISNIYTFILKFQLKSILYFI